MHRIFLLCVLLMTSIASAEEHQLFIGTYTRGGSASKGIYTCTFDDSTGKLSQPSLAVEADNPSFLAVHPSKDLLFACIETNDFGGEPTGAISSFRIDRDTNTLTLLNQQPTSGGAPCHCNVDATGKFLLVANYLGGNVAVFPINENGTLSKRSCLINHVGKGPNSQRQEAPHAHSVNLSFDSRFAYVADLGIDRIMIYRFDSQEGRLIPSAVDSVSIRPGGGPRHFSIHPSGKFAYTNNELTCETTVFARDNQSGGLTPIQTISTLPDGYDGRKSTAECLVHPSGKFLYVSNRGHDSIAAYSIDSDSGRLTLIEIEKTGGQEPRNFIVVANGKWLIAENQNSDTIVVFKIGEDGSLAATDSTIKVGKPVCIRIAG